MEIDRRNFIKMAGVYALTFGAGLAVPSCASSKVETMNLEKEPSEEELEEEAIAKLIDHARRWNVILQASTYNRDNSPYILFMIEEEVKDTNPPVPVKSGADWSNGSFMETMIVLSQALQGEDIVNIYAEGMAFKGNGFELLAESHDIGPIGYSLARAWEITKNPEFYQKAHQAAEIIAGLYDPKTGMIAKNKGGALYDVNYGHKIFPLLAWANRNCKDPAKSLKFEEIAKRSIESLIDNFQRPDGSVYHYVLKGPDGTFIKGEGETPHGYNLSNSSTWTRGMGFFLDALAGAIEEYPNQKTMDAYEKGVEFVMQRTPEDITLPFDLSPDLPENLKRVKDVSGQALIANSIFRIAEKINNPVRSEELLNYARSLTMDIAKNHITGNGGVKNVAPGYYAILKGEPDQVVTAYGNDFALKALLRSRQLRTKK